MRQPFCTRISWRRPRGQASDRRRSSRSGGRESINEQIRHYRAPLLVVRECGLYPGHECCLPFHVLKQRGRTADESASPTAIALTGDRRADPSPRSDTGLRSRGIPGGASLRSTAWALSLGTEPLGLGGDPRHLFPDWDRIACDRRTAGTRLRTLAAGAAGAANGLSLGTAGRVAGASAVRVPPNALRWASPLDHAAQRIGAVLRQLSPCNAGSSSSGSPLCQDARIAAGVAWCSAGPGSDMSEELAAGVGPVALDFVVAA